MKVTVDRQLNGGNYIVGFRVSDFTPEELQKMASFGVPHVPIDDDAYRRAMLEYTEGQQQTEFVFAVVRNVGRGAATNVGY